MDIKWLFVLVLIVFPPNIVNADRKDDMVREEMVKAMQDLQAKVPKDSRIGVDNLKADTSTHDITDFLMTALTKEGYVVLDRRSLDEIFKQYGVEMSDAFDQEKVEALGKIEGVDAILYGIVKEFSALAGKAKLNVHLQCTYLGEGGTPWAYDMVAENTSGGRKMFPFIIAGGFLILVIAVSFGLKRAGKTKVLNQP